MLQDRKGRDRLVLGLMIINLYFYPIKFDININIASLARNRDDRMDVPLFRPLLCVDQAHIQSFHQVSAEISFL